MANKDKRPARETLSKSQSTEAPHKDKPLAPESTESVLHELRVYQSELQIQNENLRHTEATLEASRLAYQDLYDHAPVGYLTLDATAVIQQSNLTVAKLLGVTRSELQEQLFINFIAIDDRDTFYLLSKKLVETKLPQSCEVKINRRNGNSFYGHIQASVALDENEQPLIRLVLSDISTLRQRKDAVRLSEAALKSVSEGVLITDANQNIISVNDAFLKITGYQKEEILGTNCRFLQGPLTDLNTVAAIRTALKNQREFSDEILNYRKDGTPFCNELTITPVFDEQKQLSHFVGITRDITENYVVREKLADMTDMLERTSEIAKVGGWEIEIPSMKFFWTRETCRIHEIDPPVTPTFEYGLSLFPPDARAIMEAALNAAIHSGTPYDLELQKYTVKGKLIWVRVQGFAVMENGKTVKLRGTIHDISERKVLEIEKESERKVLELLAQGGPLPQVLSQLVLSYENLFTGMHGSVLLLDADGLHLHHGAAPNLAKSFCDAIDGEEIGPSAGSCGTAAYTKQTVVVTDITHDPLWANYKELALTHGLQACWSVPIIGAEGRVLGTFAFYYHSPRAPQPHDLATLERGANLACLVIERYQAQAALLENEERYRTMVEWMPEAIVVHRNGSILFANPAALRLLGAQSTTDLVNKPILDFIHPDFRSVASARVTSITGQGQATSPLEYRLLKLDGSIIYGEVQSASIVYDGSPAFHTFIHDITTRKQAEAEIIATKNKLEAVIQAIPIPLFVKDAQSRFLLMNSACEKQLGISLAQLKGTDASQYFPPEQMEHFLAVDKQAFAMHQPFDMEESVWSAAYQQNRITHTFKNPVYDAAGHPQYLICAMLDITERKQMEATLNEIQMRFQAVLDYSPALISMKDLQGNILLANRNFAVLDAPPLHELIGKNVFDVFPHDIAQALWENDQAAVRADALVQVEEAVYHKDSTLHTYLTLKFPVRDASHAVFGTCAISTDITDRKQAERDLANATELLERTGEMAKIGGWLIHIPSMKQEWTLETFNIAEIEPPNEPSLEYSLSLFEPEPRAAIEAAIQASIEHGTPFDLEYPFTTAKGKALWVRAQGSAVFENGKVTQLIGTFQDISQHHRDIEEIRRLGFYDALTNLPNRRLLADRLEHSMLTSNRTGKHGALMFLDLDHFKHLNDTQGHDVGDILLQQVATRLQACVREGDSVARLGGDEFVVLLEGLSIYDFEAAAQTEHIANKILAALGEPYVLRNIKHTSTPSIGIVVFQGEHETMEELFKKADLAMYQAKAAGRNAVRFFDPAMQAAVAARAEMESTMRTALANNEFMLHYQIQVDGEGKTTGVEALVRWKHATLGPISPAVFVPMAEETGMILPLGQWVLETACNQLVEWAQNPATQDWTMAVNVSASQFSQADFVAKVDLALKRTGANPNLLKLELTESMLVHDVDSIIVKMNTIKSRGVSFSLDDFGTGYSSLTYLKRLPLDQLKIDQSFVRDVFTDPSDAVIVRTIIALGHSLGLKVIAEGVETLDQRDFLANLGCDAFQGFYFGYPGPA